MSDSRFFDFRIYLILRVELNLSCCRKGVRAWADDSNQAAGKACHVTIRADDTALAIDSAVSRPVRLGDSGSCVCVSFECVVAGYKTEWLRCGRTERCDVSRKQRNAVDTVEFVHEFVWVRSCRLFDDISQQLTVCSSSLRLANSVCAVVSYLMMMMMMSWCLMSSDVIWHIRDKLWPMPKHGSIKATYVRCMRV